MIHLSPEESALWAKKKMEDGEPRWLPLITHLLDTQNTINWLFYHWLAPAQREILTQNMSEEDMQKLVKFLGFSHDIGKATPAFQTEPSYDGSHSLDSELIENLVRNGFSQLADAELSFPRKSPHAKAGEVILKKLGVPGSISAIIGGHHGKPESHFPREQIGNYTSNYWQSDHDSGLQHPWQKSQKDLFNIGLKSSGYQNVTDIPSVTQPEAVILEGLLIMSDWLASSEYMSQDRNMTLFPLIRLDQSWDDLDMTARFQHAMTTWDLGEPWEPQKVSLTPDPYKVRWGFSARPVQATMTKAIGAMTDPGMAIVEAPMGLGKTEIALIAAEQLAYDTNRDGLFVGLPTQATTNAMFDRVEGWLDSIAHAHGTNFSIKLIHGKAAFDPTYHNLPDATNVDDAGAVVVNSWFLGKKSILTKFTVGTIDNLLLMGLKQKHLFLRHLGFSGKVVIIDEAHAYDVFMNQYLYKAIEWLGAYHVPVIILSATLPKEKRNALLIAYLKGKYGSNAYKHLLNASPGWRDNQAYPLLSLLDGNTITQVSKFDGQSDQSPVKVRVRRFNAANSELIQDVLDKLKSGGIAGIIVNTVKRAQTLAKLVPPEVKLLVLHSAFLATDRANLEEELQAAIGKNGKRPDKMIVIGTQVLEQSLDIDFDILYTDIAPIDLILQRAGRLHRHHRERPQALQTPQLTIMGINDFGDYGDANEAIYHNYLLMKTDHFLPETIVLPDDISRLVEQVYDPATDSEITEIADARDSFQTYLEKETKKAQAFQIKAPPSRHKTIHGWLDRSQDNVDQSDQRVAAAVRDIQETVEVVLIQKTDKGNYILDGRKLNDVSPQEIANQVIRIPHAVTPNVTKAIDRLETLTIKNFPEWQESIWLKDALALPLDSNFSTQLGDWQLTYSAKYGLSYSKESKS